MDPLSIAGSIAGLVSLGDAVFRGLYHYAKTVKKAEKEVLDLKNEVIALTGILHNLRIVAQDLEQDDEFDNSVRTDHVNACLATLYSLDEMLKKIEYPKDQKFRTGLRKLAWPYKSGETKELGEEIRKHREILSLALSADTTAALIRCLSSQEAMASDVKNIRLSLQRRNEIESRIRIDEERQRVLKYFLVVDSRHNYKTSLSLRHPSTGFWLTEGETFRSWLREEGSKLWLSGIPGAGKTVLSGLIIAECIARTSTDRAVAYFYCDYKSAQSQSIVNILSSLAAQLAVQHEESFNLLETYYKSLHPAQQLETDPDVEDLIDLLRRMAQLFDDVRFIIDGLDECADHTEEASEALKRLVCEEKCNISLAVLSRDDPQIRDHLGPSTCNHVEVAAHSKDIEHFVRSEIEERAKKGKLRIKSPELKKTILETLVSKAQGMFRWVTCQLDHLCELPTDAQRRKALYGLPSTLNETYERILSRINESTLPLALRALLWTTYAYSELSINALLDAVSVEYGATAFDPEARPDEEDILRSCSSLIRKRNGIFELAHFTVQEYLETNGIFAKAGLFSGPDPDIYLAKTCLTYVRFRDFDRPPPATFKEAKALYKEYPFLPHAAGHWLEYALHNPNDDRLFVQLQDLFNPMRSYNFINGVIFFLVAWEYYLFEEYLDNEMDSKIIQGFIDLATSGEFGPLHFAALLGLRAICDWLVAEDCDVNQTSSIGSPIECYILGLSYVRPYGQNLSSGHLLGHGRFGNKDELQESRPGTISALLKAGAKCKGLPTHHPSLSYSALRLTKYQRNIFPDLVKHGLPIEKDAMELLEEVFDNEMLELLFEVIRDGEELNMPPEQEDRILKLGIASNMKISSLPSQGNSSKERFYEFVLSAIRFDQIEAFRDLMGRSTLTINMTYPDIDGTLLHFAAVNHSTKIMKELLDFGFDPSWTNSKGRTVLHECATLQHDSIMRRLIENPLYIRADASGRTIWHEAAATDACRTLELLIECYGNTHPTTGLFEVSKAGETPLLEAIMAGRESSSLLLLDQLHDNDDVMKDWKLTHYSTASGLYKVIVRLMNLGVDITGVNEEEKSALHFLTRSTPLQLLDLLIDQGVSPDAQDVNGKTALHTFLDGTRHSNLADAGFSRREIDTLPKSVISRLVTAASIASLDATGCTVWHYYCKSYLPRLLLSYSVKETENNPHSDVVLLGQDIKTEDKVIKVQLYQLGLYLAKQGAIKAYEEIHGQQSGCLLLLGSCLDAMKKYSPNFRAHRAIGDLFHAILSDIALSAPMRDDAQFVRLLIWTIFEGEERTFRMLLDQGTSLYVLSVYGAHDSAMRTLCLTFGKRSMLEHSLAHTEKHLLNQLDISGKGPIHYVCGTLERYWEEAAVRLEMLLKAGVETETRTNPAQKTALHCAAAVGFVHAFQILCDHNADVQALDKNDWGIVAHAIWSKNIGMLQKLANALKDESQWTRSFTMRAPWNRDEDIPLSTIAHLAATQNQNVLDFLMGSGFFPDLNVRSKTGYTPLHLAVASGNEETAKWLLKNGATVDISNEDGMTALHCAIESGNVSVVRALLEAGAEFTPNRWGLRPEDLAPVNLLPDLIQLLIDFDVPTSVYQKLQAENKSQKFFDAVRAGDTTTCQEIIQKDQAWSQLHAPECGTCTALAVALKEKCWNVVDLLLDHDASPGGILCRHHSATAKEENLAIHLAVKYPDFNSRLDKFLKSYLKSQNHWVWSPHSPFHLAAALNPDAIDILIKHVQEHQHFFAIQRSHNSQRTQEIQVESGVLQTLLESPYSGNQNKKGSSFHTGSTALHIAAASKQPRAVKKLLASDVRIDQKNEHGRTPLHTAAYSGCVESAVTLLSCGANPNAIDDELLTPLMFACGNGYIAVVELLIPLSHSKATADLLGKTALHHALQSPNVTTFARLLRAGWDPYQQDVFGHSALHEALVSDRFSTYVSMMDFDAEQLIGANGHSKEAPPFFRKPGNFRRLFKLFSSRVPKSFLENAVNHVPERDSHPMCHAARTGDVDSIKQFLDAGVNIELLECTGSTALISASLAGQLESVKLLIQKGANLDSFLNGKPINVLDAAKANQPMVKWLLVGRHTDTPRLSNAAENDEQDGKFWSGVRELQVPLEGFYSPTGQSRLDWTKWIYKQKGNWRQMVPLDWNVVAHLTPLPGESIDGT